MFVQKPPNVPEISLYLFKSHLRCHLYFTAWYEPWSLLFLRGADEDPVFFVSLALPTPLPSLTLMSPGWSVSFCFIFCNSESGVSFSWWQLLWLPDEKALSPYPLSAAKSLQSCLTLCDPLDGSPPGSTIPGILQARTQEWVAISFSNAWRWKVKVKLLSHVRLLSTPSIAAYQAPLSMEFSRKEYWSGVPLPSPFYEIITSNTSRKNGDIKTMQFCIT